jgi:hypothetical protein
VGALLGGVEVLGDGAGFVDARGAVLLPGHAGGPGALRRRPSSTGCAPSSRGWTTGATPPARAPTRPARR